MEREPDGSFYEYDSGCGCCSERQSYRTIEELTGLASYFSKLIGEIQEQITKLKEQNNG